MKVFVAAVLSSLGASAALAHVAHEQNETLRWQWQPWLACSLAIVASFYIAGVVRLQRGGQLARIAKWWRVLAFGAGIAATVVALASPLDGIAAQSFAAHMAQHMLLMMVAAPLCALGVPADVTPWALSLAQRRGVAAWWRRRWMLGRVCNACARPWPAWLLASGALWFWHLPRPYAWALGNEFVHTIEHASFFVGAFLLWSHVADRRALRRTGHGVAIAVIATFGMHSGLLGALLTFAETPLYALRDASALGLSPLQDQQLAGLIMWVPAGFVHLLALALAMGDWLAESARRNRGRWRSLPDAFDESTQVRS